MRPNRDPELPTHMALEYRKQLVYVVHRLHPPERTNQVPRKAARLYLDAEILGCLGV